MRPAVRIPAPRHLGVPGAFLLLVLAAACSAADSGPKSIIPGAMALGKFCHELNRGGAPVTLTLQIGDPAITNITAKTGVCAPMAGMPCATIPMGLVPVKLFEGDRMLSSRSVVLNPPAAGQPTKEYVFQAVITTNNDVVVTGGQIATGSCQGLDFPPPDGGILDGGGDGAVPEAGTSEGGLVSDASLDAPLPSADAAADAGAPDVAGDAGPAADAGADMASD
jgi:hypothetical protein